MKNRICFITTGLGMGGAERQICDLSDELCVRHNEVLIIALTGKSIVKPKNDSVRIVELNMQKTLVGLIKALCECRAILKDFNPNIVHSHMVHANIFTRILRLCTKMPMLVCTAHNTNEGGKGRLLAYRYTNFLADINTNVSDEAVEAFIHSGAVKSDQMIMVANGFDDKRFVYSSQAREEKRQELNISSDTFLYLAIGRLEEQKDYPNMLNAMTIVVKAAIENDKKVKLAIIGQSYLEQELKQLTNDLGLNDYVMFLGLQRNVECWLSAADCFVLSSEYEGFCLVTAEALLTECLVVATDCGGVKEGVGDGGFVVPPKNSEALAQAMIKAISISKQERAAIVKKGRDRIIKFYSIAAITNKWLEIYQGYYK
ncbi:glycosyl transferase [Photobacterium phosphoreum]|uniref:Glycosyl transferase n=1 Tax=Photobacterium phosphoreum TaxID=659 RepID=A0A2T3JFQ9_PHOPO|nr:glycosyltransferase [Photobacterium phosphoreum]PSU20046.1 glycosyl transferase [Photobacterium phosphoreum]PSU37745.1 glycosyl transferase [Photobacterium phosphoreum]PSU47779.1 glycosyl transferase [Photobacterium phosphoreum]